MKQKFMTTKSTVVGFIGATSSRLDGPGYISRTEKIWYVYGKRTNMSLGFTSIYRWRSRFLKRYRDNLLVELCNTFDLDIEDLTDQEILMLQCQMYI